MLQILLWGGGVSLGLLAFVFIFVSPSFLSRRSVEFEANFFDRGDETKLEHTSKKEIKTEDLLLSKKIRANKHKESIAQGK